MLSNTVLPLINFIPVMYFVHPDRYSTHPHKYRIKYCFAIKPHCKSTSLEFTTLRMSIETGSLRFVKVRLYQRPLKYPGLLNFSFIYYNQSPIVTVIIIKV